MGRAPKALRGPCTVRVRPANREALGATRASFVLRNVVELRGFEPLTF